MLGKSGNIQRWAEYVNDIVVPDGGTSTAAGQINTGLLVPPEA